MDHFGDSVCVALRDTYWSIFRTVCVLHLVHFRGSLLVFFLDSVRATLAKHYFSIFGTCVWATLGSFICSFLGRCVSVAFGDDY